MAGRGGARHFKKPFVETGLLMKCLKQHEELLKDFKGYESLSRNNGVDTKGLVHALGFVNDILDLEPSGEVHAQPLRNSLLHLLTNNPHWDTTQQIGSVWVHMRSERINVLLFHVRKLARSGLNASCAAALTSLEYKRLQDTLEKVDLAETCVVPLGKGDEKMTKKKKEDECETPLKKGKSSGPKDPTPLKKGKSSGSKGPTPLKKGRRLKKTIIDVSLDSDGFPKALKGPPKPKLGRLLNRRLGQKRPLEASAGEGEEEDNRSAMGFTRKKPAGKAEPLKKGTGKPLKKGTDKPLKKGTAADMSGPGPWLKLHKAMAAKPKRAYILGTKSSEVKPKLVVEVSQTMSKKCSFVVDKIKDALENENLSKEEAKDLRKTLCAEYP